MKNNLKMHTIVMDVPTPFGGRQKLHMFRWLASLLNQGYPLADSMETLGGVKNKYAGWMKNMAHRVKQGNTLGKAMTTGDNVRVPRIIATLVEAGEKYGIVPQALDLACDIQSPLEGLKFRQELLILKIYLAFISTLFFWAFTVLALKVMPVFFRIFSDLGQPLPSFTRLMVDTCNFIYYNFPFLFFGVIIAALVFLLLRRALAERIFPLLPGVKRWHMYSNSWRLSYGVGRLMENGVPFNEALKTMGMALKVKAWVNASERIAAKTREGKSVSEALSGESKIPAGLHWGVSFGESNGDIAGTLVDMGEKYQSLSNILLLRTLRIFEVILILVFVAVIGSMVFPIYIPIFGLANMGM